MSLPTVPCLISSSSSSCCSLYRVCSSLFSLFLVFLPCPCVFQIMPKLKTCISISIILIFLSKAFTSSLFLTMSSILSACWSDISLYLDQPSGLLKLIIGFFFSFFLTSIGNFNDNTIALWSVHFLCSSLLCLVFIIAKGVISCLTSTTKF